MTSTTPPASSWEKSTGSPLQRYENRRRTYEKRTNQQICEGDPRDIAYENLIQLYTTLTTDRILHMIKGHPAENHMNRNILRKRFSIAISRLATDRQVLVSRIEEEVTAARKAVGLQALPQRWYEEYEERYPHKKRTQPNVTREELRRQIGNTKGYASPQPKTATVQPKHKPAPLDLNKDTKKLDFKSFFKQEPEPSPVWTPSPVMTYKRPTLKKQPERKDSVQDASRGKE